MCKITTTKKKKKKTTASSTATATTSSSSSSNSGTNNSTSSMELHLDDINTIRAGKRITGTVSIPRSIRRAIEAAESADIVKASSSPSFSFEDEEKVSPARAKDSNNNNTESNRLCIYIEFIGKETTVVSTPKTYARPETFDIKYLKKNRGEYGLLYRKGIELVSNFDDVYHDNHDTSDENEIIMVPFQFTLPPNLPCSMEYFGKHQEKYALPHQCAVSYSIEAHIPFTKHSVSQSVQVYGQIGRTLSDVKLSSNSESDDEDKTKEYDDKYDFYFNDSISLHIGESVPVLKSYLCGMWNQPINTYTLRSLSPILCLHPGQALPAFIPQFALLAAHATAAAKASTSAIDVGGRSDKTTILIKLTERVRWSARQRLKDEIMSWTLSPNKKSKSSSRVTGMDEEEKKEYDDGDVVDDYYNDDLIVHVPRNVRLSFRGRLIEVRHDLIVSVHNAANETIATTNMIPVVVLSDGSDAGCMAHNEVDGGNDYVYNSDDDAVRPIYRIRSNNHTTPSIQYENGPLTIV